MQTNDLTPAQHDLIADKVVTRCYDLHPNLSKRYGPGGRQKCMQDTRYHLQYLYQAISIRSPALFTDYVQWAKIMLQGVRVPEEDLRANLEAMHGTFEEMLDVARTRTVETALDYISRSIHALPGMAAENPSFLRPEEPHAALASRYLSLLLNGERREATSLILSAVQDGVSVSDIYLRVFQPVQREIGRLWQLNRLTVAQEHFCTAITQMTMSLLYPKIFSGRKNGYRLLATCVGSELHEIGVRMVADFFEMRGWDTYYIGANAPVSTILAALKSRRAHVLGVSTTMTFHLSTLMALIRSVRTEPELSKVKVIVGGYPFNVDPDLWKTVGADAFGTDAEDSERRGWALVQ